MTKTRAQRVAESQKRQLDAGWRRVNLRLPPEAAAALDEHCRISGLPASQVIALLLTETPPE